MDSDNLHAVVVSKDHRISRRVDRILRNGDFTVHRLRDIGQVMKTFGKEDVDLMIIDSIGEYENHLLIRTLREIASKSPLTRILLLVAPEDIDIAVTALKAGSYHYAKLPVSDEELRLLIETAIEDRPEYGTSGLLRNGKRESRIGQLAGKSPAMQRVYKQIRRAASTDIPLLLLGETGTGKDLVAQTIHRLSKRQKHPYVAVNLGSLPSELVASELFGHEKGAFTGATEQHKGVFEQGNRGTVFLDEIDCINEKVKVSLLRLLEENHFTRLGGRTPIENTSRLIAASNADLEALVEEGSFRKDLFYRLDVFRITLPPLRERQEDIIPLAEEFLSGYNHTLNKNILRISRSCIDLLEGFDWPGNVRELKNVIQRAVLVCDSAELLPEHLPPRFRKGERVAQMISFEVGTPLDDVEREMVIRALEAARNNRKQAAKLLGISRRAIYNKLKKHKIE